MREYAKTHADFEVARELAPEYPNLLNASSWQLATCLDAKFRDGQLALQLAQKTNDVNTLAAAYAETGAFADAVAAQKNAIEQLARWPEPNGQKAAVHRVERRTQMQSQLAAYGANRPYRGE